MAGRGLHSRGAGEGKLIKSKRIEMNNYNYNCERKRGVRGEINVNLM